VINTLLIKVEVLIQKNIKICSIFANFIEACEYFTGEKIEKFFGNGQALLKA